MISFDISPHLLPGARFMMSWASDWVPLSKGQIQARDGGLPCFPARQLRIGCNALQQNSSLTREILAINSTNTKQHRAQHQADGASDCAACSATLTEKQPDQLQPYFWGITRYPPRLSCHATHGTCS